MKYNPHQTKSLSNWACLNSHFSFLFSNEPYNSKNHHLTPPTGEWEHKVVSTIKQFIPAPIQQFWHDWRAAMKTTEKEATGDNEISEKVEMAGWGVEEAEKANSKADASVSFPLPPLMHFSRPWEEY